MVVAGPGTAKERLERFGRSYIPASSAHPDSPGVRLPIVWGSNTSWGNCSVAACPELLLPCMQSAWAARLILAFCWCAPVIVRVWRDYPNDRDDYHDFELEFGCALVSGLVVALPFHPSTLPPWWWVCLA